MAFPVVGRLTVSAGVATRALGVSGDELLREADAALYEAKHCGRNHTVAFVPALEAAARR